MKNYVVLSWLQGRPPPKAREALCAHLQTDGFDLVHECETFWVFTTGMPIRLLASGSGVVIGDLFDAAGAAAPSSLDFDVEHGPEALAKTLTNTFWGRFVVAVFPKHGRAHAYRDPSGALDALSWTNAGLTVLTSTLTDALASSVGRRLSIDWTEVHRQVAHPIDITAGVALEGMHGLAPGQIMELGVADPFRRQIWSPARLARTTQTGPALKHVLRATVERCILAFGPTVPTVIEASGGFDSSIVAATMSGAGADVRTLLNYATLEPSGDERVYAQALGEHLDRPITVRWKRQPNFTPEGLGRAPFAARPSLMALDDDYDADAADTCRAAGAMRMLTGQGGDAVFFQFAQPAVIVDRTRRLGRMSLASPELAALARWTRRSAFNLVGLALRSSSKALLMNQPPETPWIRPAPPAAHPWLSDLDDIPPAKRFQIENIAYTLLNHGVSRRSAAVDVIHPLLSQPIVELCLQIPVDLLVRGGRDRALARSALQHRLPALIAERRSKGELGMLYGRSMSAALPLLRRFLLEGRLAEQGIIDPVRLAPVLDQAHLAQHAGLLEILRTAAIEAWVRHWEAKIAALSGRSDGPAA